MVIILVTACVFYHLSELFSFSVLYIPSYSSHTQTAQFWPVMADVLLGGRWRPRTSGVGRSACTGEGNTSVEVPSSPLAGSSLLLTALLSKRRTWGVKVGMMRHELRGRKSQISFKGISHQSSLLSGEGCNQDQISQVQVNPML